MPLINKHKIYIIVLGTVLLFLFPAKVYADMGPKPQITIHVINPPEEEYYLDLLVRDSSAYDNLDDDRVSYDQTKLALLESYNEEGWYPGLTQGTGVPMRGKLTGVTESGQMVHIFGYVGVPEDFKIIIITPGNQILVSDEIHKNSFEFTVTYDYETGEITRENIAFSYVKQFLMTCIPTLLMEGIILLLFRFSLKRNWKSFLGINIATQLFLTAALGRVMFQDGLFAGYFVLIPLEIIIFLFEMLAFSKLLKQHSKSRRVWFVFVANLFSFIAGFLLMGYNI